MGFEPIQPTFGDAPAPDVARVVTVRRIKKMTLMGTACNIGGAVCFIRSSTQGKTRWLSQLLRLTPAEPLTEGVVVFGLSGQALSTLKNDAKFVKAVDNVLAMGTRLELQNRRLTLTVGNGHVNNFQTELSSDIGIAAARIEAVGVHPPLNDSVDSTRLIRPYRVYAFVAAMLFGICLPMTPPTLAPLHMASWCLVLGGLLAIAVAGGVLPLHLRKSQIAGAFISSAAISTLMGSFFLGSGAAMLANTYLGEKLRTPREVHVDGTVGITRGKHTSCWLYADAAGTNIVAGQSVRRLPLKCGDVHYQAQTVPHLYDLEVNPGFLDVPFVQSVHELDNQPPMSPMPNALASPIPYRAPLFHAEPAPIPYLTKLAQRINPHIIWHGTGSRLRTTIAIRCAPDGKLLSVMVIRSSGNPSWDDAVLQAIRNSDPLPVDANGKARERFNLTVQSKSQ